MSAPHSQRTPKQEAEIFLQAHIRRDVEDGGVIISRGTLTAVVERFFELLAQPSGPADDGYHVFKDGNSWCAVGAGFVNLQESKAGFGHTPLVALSELIVEEGA